MLTYIIRRLLWLVPIMIGATALVFFVMNGAPGDPVTIMFGSAVQQMDPSQIKLIREKWGLNDPVHIRYFRYLSNLLHGDLGVSIRSKRPVLKLILERAPNTIQLALGSMFIAIIIGIPAGVVSAINQYSLVDNIVTVFAFIGISMPNFWLGLMLMWLFGLALGWLPIAGMGHQGIGSTLSHLILPSIALGTAMTASLARLTRSGMLEVLNEEYIKTARAKGLKERIVIWKHAFRNSMISVVTVLGLQLATLLGGAVVVETMFAWPGLGRLTINAIWARDYFVVVGSVLGLTGVFVLANLILDLSYAIIDPKITYD